MDKKPATNYGVYVGDYCKPLSKSINQKVNEPTVVMSRAIEVIEQMGNYKVVAAIIDFENLDKPPKERLHTFCDIKGKKLREAIYKEIEDECKW